MPAFQRRDIEKVKFAGAKARARNEPERSSVGADVALGAWVVRSYVAAVGGRALVLDHCGHLDGVVGVGDGGGLDGRSMGASAARRRPGVAGARRGGAGTGGSAMNLKLRIVRLPEDPLGFVRRECPDCHRQFKTKGWASDSASVHRRLAAQLPHENPDELFTAT